MAELKNLLNIRVRGLHNNKIMNAIKHNIRHVQSRSDINNKNNILIDIHKNTSYEYLSTKNSLSYRMYKDFSNKYKNDRVEHNQNHKKYRKRNAREYHSSWAEGVLTFSEAINEDLGVKYSEQKLIKIAQNMLLEFESQWNTKVTLATLHLSEKTPHFHFLFKNYDNQGKSITHKHRDRVSLSQLQDLMYKHFKVLGMKRGVKKSNEDCGVYEYQKPKFTQIEELKNKIKELKNIRKSLSNDISIAKDIKKKLYGDITVYQKDLRKRIKLISNLMQNNLRLKGLLLKTEEELRTFKDKEKEQLLQDIQKAKMSNTSEDQINNIGGLK